MRSNASTMVIGGGIIGLSVAYNLAKMGARDIVLVERGCLASGSTGRCAAGVRQQFGTEINCRLAQRSIQILENLTEELEYEGDIEFKQQGYLIVAYTEKEWDQFQKNLILQNQLSIPSRLVTPQEAVEIVPTLNPRGLLGATFCGKDGHCNPFHTSQAYAQAARRLGVEINCGVTVSGLHTQDGRVRAVQTTLGSISTEAVVIAAGAYSQMIAEMAGVRIPIYPERHQILVTEPVDPIQSPMVMSFARRFYCQQTPHGSFLMGMGDASERHDYDTGHSWQFLEEIARVACDILPALMNVRLVRQWSGLYEMTPDSQPVLGDVPGVRGLYIAAGYSGHGFMLGPVTGTLMTEMILKKTVSIDISMLDCSRFDRGELVLEPSVV